MSVFVAVYAPPAATLGLFVATEVATIGGQLAPCDRHERQHIAQPPAGTGLAGR